MKIEGLPYPIENLSNISAARYVPAVHAAESEAEEPAFEPADPPLLRLLLGPATETRSAGKSQKNGIFSLLK